MAIKVTTTLLQKLFTSRTKAELEPFVAPINELAIEKYQINTKDRLAMFLAQTGHESGEYRTFVENLNYSAQGLIKTWPNRFTAMKAAQYARQPEKIANYVYANRLGNGSEHSGDGWRYRGVGLIQNTGKYNHSEFAKYIGKPLAEATAYCHTHRGAVEVACWFWDTRKINAIADQKDVEKIIGEIVTIADVDYATRVINGGRNGLAHRTALYKAALPLIKG